MELAELVQGLKDKDPHARYASLKALVAHPEGGEALEDASLCRLVVRICRQDKLPYNRLEAMSLLRRVWPSTEISSAFEERLGDDPYIAEACIRILGEIADKTAYELLVKAYLGTKQLRTRLQIIQAYTGASQDAVFHFLQATGAHDSSQDSIRASIIIMLGKLGNPTLRSIFLKALQDKNSRVRANAVEAISGILQGKELLQVLSHCTRDRNNRVQANALRALILLGVRQAEPLVHEMAHHQNPNFRRSAAWLLGEVGCQMQNGHNWLESLTQDGDQNVLYRASLAIKKLEDQLVRRRAA